MSASATSERTVPVALRRRWWVTAGGFVAAAMLFAHLVAMAFEPLTGVLWIVSSTPVCVYQLWFLSRTLDRNRPQSADYELCRDDPGAVAGTFGVANGVTLTRGWLYAALAGFLVVVPPAGSAWRWLPAVCYGGGAALDAVDGAVARRVGRRSELGEKLDMAFDTVGFLVAPLVGVAWGRLPVWYLSISAARYLFKTGRGWRRRRGRPVYDLPPSRVRRPLAALQMAFITAALAPVVPTEVVVPAAAVVVAPSLAVFARDYLVVSGRLRGDGHGDAAAADADRTDPTPER